MAARTNPAGLDTLKRHSEREAQPGDSSAAPSFSQVSLMEEGAGLPEVRAQGSEGLISSSSSAMNLHALPSLSLCLLVCKMGLIGPFFQGCGEDWTR